MSNLTETYNNLRSSRKFQKRLSMGTRLIIALFLIIFSIFPILWIVSASFDNTNSLGSQTLIPAHAGFNNYRDLFGLNPNYKFGDLIYWKWVFNSVKIASITTILSLSLTTMAAYAFSRMRFAGRVTILKAILLIQVFPNLLALVAIYVLIFQTGEIIPRVEAGSPQQPQRFAVAPLVITQQRAAFVLARFGQPLVEPFL